MRRTEQAPEKKMTFVSYGGVGGRTTGSCHRLGIRGSALLVDCGLFQGWHDENSEKKGERMNLTPLDEAGRGVSDVLLTHAHVDHSGRLPILYKIGFSPTTYTTRATKELLIPMLENSAQIQESKGGDKLYTRLDVDKALLHTKGVAPFKVFPVGEKHKGINAEFLTNGHVIGSSAVLIRDPNSRQSVLFTGDIGKPHQSLCGGYVDIGCRHPYPQDPIHTLVVESTCIEKKPVSFEEKINSFVEEITRTWKEGGIPLLPVLSLHREQEIIEMLHHLQAREEFKGCKVVIDAPLAENLRAVIMNMGPDQFSRRYGDDPKFYKTDEESMARFDLSNVEFIGDHQSSLNSDRRYAASRERVIILASGGMGGHGRMVNYTRGEFKKNPKNAIIFTCFQVPGTEGAGMLQAEAANAKKPRKTARVAQVGGFSGHASGSEEMFGFLERFNLRELGLIIVTHGRDSARNAMAERFKEHGFSGRIILPRIGQAIVF